MVKSSKISGTVATNEEFKLNVVIDNAGTSAAYSVQAVFSSADLAPLKNGGIVVLNSIEAGEQENIAQSFEVTGAIWGKNIIPVDVTVTYYDDKGTSYSDKFTLSIPTTNGWQRDCLSHSHADGCEEFAAGHHQLCRQRRSSPAGRTIHPDDDRSKHGKCPRPTRDHDRGRRFERDEWQRDTAAGRSLGGSGEFTNFAPVGASNVQTLGDLGAGDMIQAKQNLIVNVSTNPGAYPMKVTFSYLNDKSEVINDEQVITLLVYSLPTVDVSFYRPPDPFFVGQPGALPIQVVNLGKRLAVLGNMKIEQPTRNDRKRDQPGRVARRGRLFHARCHGHSGTIRHDDVQYHDRLHG